MKQQIALLAVGDKMTGSVILRRLPTGTRADARPETGRLRPLRRIAKYVRLNMYGLRNGKSPLSLSIENVRCARVVVMAGAQLGGTPGGLPRPS